MKLQASRKCSQQGHFSYERSIHRIGRTLGGLICWPDTVTATPNPNRAPRCRLSPPPAPRPGRPPAGLLLATLHSRSRGRWGTGARSAAPPTRRVNQRHGTDLFVLRLSAWLRWSAVPGVAPRAFAALSANVLGQCHMSSARSLNGKTSSLIFYF